MAPHIIRDLSDTSGYWAAIWSICPMPDVHVICDAPIGCFNLVGTAVPDYTDAVPHIENLTPAVLTEQEVGGKGTAPTVRRAYEGLRDNGVLGSKQVIVVSTAESEMIGADHSDLVKQLGTGTTFYYSNSLGEDEWAGRDRVLRWLWQTYGANHVEERTPKLGSVNIIGPTYGCFNAPSDLEEIKRMVLALGGTINLVYPYEARLADTPRLADAQVNIVLYREFGAGLAQELGQPLLHAPIGIQETTAFVRELGQLLGRQEQAEAFVQHEKRTTLQAVWDLWRGPQSDWFATTDIGIVAGRSYADGLARLLGDELGMPIAFMAGRPLKPGEPANDDVRRRLHQRAPAFVWGSINERIYLAEAGARMTHWLPAAFPGAVVRRAVGTPIMGYRGAVYVVQEIVNRLYDTLFNVLPVDGAYAKPGGGPPVATNGSSSLLWQPDARARLDAALEHVPYISRISASRQLQMQIEGAAQTHGASEITSQFVEEVLAQNT